MSDKSWVYTVISELMLAAVAHQSPLLRAETIRACDKAFEQYGKEEEVIKAAKALPPIPIGRLPFHSRVPFRKFRRALEALQEVEGE